MPDSTCATCAHDQRTHCANLPAPTEALTDAIRAWTNLWWALLMTDPSQSIRALVPPCPGHTPSSCADTTNA